MVEAQDIHWTMNNMSPLTLNPANTGAYEGSYRIGGIYRDQFNNISGAIGFKTPSFYVDAPIARGFRKTDWVGIGALVYSDQAGASKLNTIGTFASIAYHLSLNGKGTTHLTLGVQGGLVQRSVDPNSSVFVFEDELLSGSTGTSPNRALLLENKRFVDINTGLKLSSKLSENTDLEFGVAVKHLTQPAYSLVKNQSEKLPLRLTAHSTFNFNLSNNWGFSPSFVFDNLNKMQEGIVIALVAYHFNQDLTFRLGGGYRFGDAAAPIVEVHYKQLKAGISYDITLSELNDINNNQGGFEIGLSYIIRQYKEPKTEEILFCPRF